MSGYQDWERQFDGHVKLVVNVSKKVLHEACELLYARIVARTPIGNPALWERPYWPKGYTPGSLRAAWKIEHFEDTVVISNDLPYALRVEEGWSTKQAPAGMMRVSLIDFNAIVDLVAKKYKI